MQEPNIRSGTLLANQTTANGAVDDRTLGILRPPNLQGIASLSSGGCQAVAL